jgi:hypothetical protein
MLYLISKEKHAGRWAVVVRPLAKCIAVVDAPDGDGYVVCDHGSGPQRFPIQLPSIVSEKNLRAEYVALDEWCDEDNIELDRLAEAGKGPSE